MMVFLKTRTSKLNAKNCWPFNWGLKNFSNNHCTVHEWHRLTVSISTIVHQIFALWVSSICPEMEQTDQIGKFLSISRNIPCNYGLAWVWAMSFEFSVINNRFRNVWEVLIKRQFFMWWDWPVRSSFDPIFAGRGRGKSPPPGGFLDTAQKRL